MFQNKKEKKELEELTNSSTIVAKGTVLEGNIETFGNIRIEGKVVGNIKSKSKVVLSESCVVEGNILAHTAEVSGEVKGTIEISDVVVVKATALINGDLITNKMIMESGATFNGQCKMGATIKEIQIGEGERIKPIKQEKTA